MSGAIRALRSMLVVAALCAAAPAAGEPASVDALARLEAAVADHPDDPDLAWALATELERQERLIRAEQVLLDLIERWPAHRPDAWLALARVRYGLELDPEALEALAQAERATPHEAEVHLYRGLVLRRLGRVEEAGHALARAAEIEPTLRAETLLLRALGAMDLDLADEADRLLREVVSADPEGEIGRRARLLLGQGVREKRFPLRLMVFGGLEADNNVSLEGDSELPNLSGERRDERAVWGVELAWRAWQGERFQLTLGARYDQSEHRVLEEYDHRRELGYLTAQVNLAPRLDFRLDAIASRERLADERYRRTRLLRPNLFVTIGPRAGVLRLWSDLEQLSYPEDPLFDSLDRDGVSIAGGIEHFVALPGLENAWGSLAVSFARRETDAQRDVLGFASPYEHDVIGTRLRMHVPLPFGFESDLSGSWGRDRYHHRNVFDALFANGVGTAFPNRRRDTVTSTTFVLSREVLPWVDLELVASFLRRTSNVELYEYDRRVVGLYFRVATP